MISGLYRLSQKQGLGYSLRKLCHLFGVNRAWYYQRQKKVEKANLEEESLKQRVEQILGTYSGYGYRRVTKALQKAGEKINHKRVRRLLKKWGLGWKRWRRRKPLTSVNDPKAAREANRLVTAKQGGEINAPDRAWVGDVLFVATKKEEGYLATLLDGFSRKVVGWAVSRHNDTPLTLRALQMAIGQRRPEAGLIHHTDKGSNYTSREYREQLTAIGAVVSHSQPGRPQQNGMAESFNKTVSYEKLYLEEFQNLAEVTVGLEDWLERIYNGGRLHSSLGYQSPVEFEHNWLTHIGLESGLVK
jgi:transposase InsO family protein